MSAAMKNVKMPGSANRENVQAKVPVFRVNHFGAGPGANGKQVNAFSKYKGK